jgi:hypothetical protein
LENDFKKKSGLVSISERVVDTQNKLSIVKQCRLLKIHRGGLYYKETGKFRELENNAITRPTVF